MKAPCGQQDCACGRAIEALVKALEAVKVRDGTDGLWLLFDNGKQKGAVNARSPGPIVRVAILGWFRQARRAIEEAKK